MDFIRLRNTLGLLGIAVAAVWLGQFLWNLGGRFGIAILIFLLAWLVSFAVSPAVRRLERARLRRLPATIVVYILMLTVAVVVALFGMPSVLQDLSGIAARLGGYGDDVQRLTNEVLRWLRSVGVPEAALEDAVSDLGSNFAELGATVVGGLISALTGIATAVLVFVLTLIVSFYVVLDWDRSLKRFEDSLPGVWGTELREAVHTVEATFTGFLRGQLIESALFGLAVGITMAAAGLDFIILIAILSGLALVVPFIGPVVGLAAPVLVALLESPTTALWVGIVLLVLQVVLENVVKPRLIGNAVGVHPLVVIAGILAGSAAAGFWGAIFGVPIGALVYFAARAAYARWVAVASKIGKASGGNTAPAERDLLDTSEDTETLTGGGSETPPDAGRPPVPEDPGRIEA